MRDIERSSPQGRGGNVTFRFIMYSVPGGQKLDLSLRADDELKEIELTRRAATYSYMDGDAFVFMDIEDYTQYQLDANVVGDTAGYITDGLEGCYVQLIDDAPVAVQLPPSVHARSRRDRAGTQGRAPRPSARSRRSSTPASRSRCRNTSPPARRSWSIRRPANLRAEPEPVARAVPSSAQRGKVPGRAEGALFPR